MTLMKVLICTAKEKTLDRMLTCVLILIPVIKRPPSTPTMEQCIYPSTISPHQMNTIPVGLRVTQVITVVNPYQKKIEACRN